MRVEEMYLIKAEAEAMGGNLSGGKSTLETFVRTYWDPSFTSKANSAQDFQDEVWSVSYTHLNALRLYAGKSVAE